MSVDLFVLAVRDYIIKFHAGDVPQDVQEAFDRHMETEELTDEMPEPVVGGLGPMHLMYRKN